jgi:hypothetical protein
MNAHPDPAVWLSFTGSWALQAALVVAVAATAQRWIPSAAWRRTLWQSCFAGVAVLVVLELSGLTHATVMPLLAGRRGPAAGEARSGGQQADTPVSPPSLSSIAGQATHRGSTVVSLAGPDRLESGLGASKRRAELGETAATREQPTGLVAELGRSARAITANPTEVCLRWLPWLLGGLWLAGAAVMAGWLGGARVLFWLDRKDREPVTDEALQQQVLSLARQLGITRPVRLVRSARLSCAAAFGWFRPAVALPRDFEREHSHEQQAVMLAHELAHLGSHDPGWYGLADAMVVLLWWHPAIWWARKQLHWASETAADEACLLVQDGPALLAECLLAVGTRLSASPRIGWVGMAGSSFRSGLGRRVARLVELRDGCWCRPNRWPTRLTMVLAPVSLAGFSLLSVAWTIPQPPTPRVIMKNHYWQNSLAAMVVLAVWPAVAEPPAPALPPPVSGSPSARPAAAVPAALSPRQNTSSPAVTDTASVADAASAPASQEALALRARLEAVTFDRVSFDSLPLVEVVKQLSDQAAKRSPDKAPVNFLFSRARSADKPPGVDPATGLATEAEQIDLSSVAIRVVPELHQLRLVDVLDAIITTAEVPITYHVEPYAVVFSAGCSGPQPRSNASASGERRETEALRARLESITLDVFLDGLPLSEVVKGLSDQAVKRSPDKGPVNFVFGRQHPTASAMASPSAGLPGAPMEAVDLCGLSIRIVPALQHVRLIDALDAIVKVAERPIRYELAPFGVVFFSDPPVAKTPPSMAGLPGPSPVRPPGFLAEHGTSALPATTVVSPPALQTRAFRVPRSFLAGAEKAFQKKIEH